MDVFNGEGHYEELLFFKETAAIGEKWAFFGIDNSNFILNSGSYFVLEAGLLIYILAHYLINKLCVLFSKAVAARKVGMFVHIDGYW